MSSQCSTLLFVGNGNGLRVFRSKLSSKPAGSFRRRSTLQPGLLENASDRKHEDVELMLDVLGSTVTRRDARSYLSRFRSEKPKSRSRNERHDDVGVNLGNLYLPVRAVEQNPVFRQGPRETQAVSETPEQLHTALIKIRRPQAIDDATLQGVCLTLVQLVRLGMSSAVVLDCGNEEQRNSLDLRRLATEQANRIAASIDQYGGPGARCLDNALATSLEDEAFPSSVKVQSGTCISNRDLLLNPLRRGIIPVVIPTTFVRNDQRLVNIPADEAMLALTREFAGVRTGLVEETDPHEIAEKIQQVQKEISLDRIILLDPLGGIPSTDEQSRSRVFVNLEQDYESIRSEILGVRDSDSQSGSPGDRPASRDPASKVFSFGEEGNYDGAIAPSTGYSATASHHLNNLALLRNCLAILPPSSSGLATTPENAANANRRPVDSGLAPGVGTRRQRNPLIHNLLTDKPVSSSSLPTDRAKGSASPTTFIKRGMPVSIIPDPRMHPWTPPSESNPSISLSDPRIDLPRLIHLIEDSFSRKLDVQHYLSRIEGRIAGIIIAGEYEGGALLTWESPCHATGQWPLVPYLDKFAVLKRSQGSGGVADILFKAMVKDCLPSGVCWRSRRDNPANKWYFERARGTWKLPGSSWTMFWTTEGVQVGQQGRDRLLRDYESVCRGVVPSWADAGGKERGVD
ncbi:MAG: hypothetical protein LQ350_000905 [Teloschistes chrysophthalmus]|nr:MAG: hypothetical protein LQ350_000905 [Niorma chrysophthalma]